MLAMRQQLAMVANGAMRGAGDSTPGMFSTLTTRGGLSLILAYVFGIWLDYGSIGVWIALLIGLQLLSLADYQGREPSLRPSYEAAWEHIQANRQQGDLVLAADFAAGLPLRYFSENEARVNVILQVLVKKAACSKVEARNRRSWNTKSSAL